MNGYEIENILKQYTITKNIFRGVFSADTLPPIKHDEIYPCSFISNTDPSDKPGQHWVAYYFESKDKLPEYFCSFGLPPLIQDLINFIPTQIFKFSNKCLQNMTSAYCGYYAIYYILFRCHNFSYDSILKHFTKNTKMNDKYIDIFFDKLNDSNTSAKTILRHSKKKKSQVALPKCQCEYINLFSE